MENIYQEAVRAVEDGARFKVDFQTRSLKIDGKYVSSGTARMKAFSECRIAVKRSSSRKWKSYTIATSTPSRRNVARVHRGAILQPCRKEN